LAAHLQLQKIHPAQCHRVAQVTFRVVVGSFLVSAIWASLEYKGGVLDLAPVLDMTIDRVSDSGFGNTLPNLCGYYVDSFKLIANYFELFVSLQSL
jgi:hypothetical protein